MDPNLMSCPTCGHAVSSTAGACTYCGAIISRGGDKDQTAAQIAAKETQSTVSEPPEQSAEIPLAVELTEEEAAAGRPSESVLAQQMPAEPIAAESAEPATEAAPSAEAPAEEAEAELEVAPPEKEPAATPDPETLRPSTDSRSNFEITSTVAVEPAAVFLFEPATAGNPMPEDEAPAAAENRSVGSAHPTAAEQIQAESGPEEMLVSPAPEVLDLAAEEPVESETLGAEIIEMVETLASEDQAQPSKASDGRSAPNKAAGESQDGQPDGRQPTEMQETAADENGGLISEALEETILLEPADEVQIPAKAGSGQVEEKRKTDTPKSTGTAKAGSGATAAEPKMRPDVLKIENAAREMAAAIKKQQEKSVEVENLKAQKAETDKIQALKKQRAALANEQAKKKQKLLLAKAAALKRKKAAEAKAPSLKRQKDAPAGSDPPQKENAAAAGSRQEDTPTAIARNLEVNSKLQDLLKKYEGRTIGINYDNSAEIREALLEEANREYFSVFVKDKQLHYSYPLKTILTVIEGKEGVDAGSSKQPHKYNAVIKVYPLVLF
jgi:hypothetical protein